MSKSQTIGQDRIYILDRTGQADALWGFAWGLVWGLAWGLVCGFGAAFNDRRRATATRSSSSTRASWGMMSSNCARSARQEAAIESFKVPPKVLVPRMA